MKDRENMTGHHLILGKCTDFLTGEPLDDTHDERYRQKIARHLVETGKYQKKEIQPRFDLPVRAGDCRAVLKIDFLIRIENQIGMIIKFGPGSLVTRHRSTLAASRLVAPYQVPIAVVTNGEDADILDGKTGNRISNGMDEIHSREALSKFMASVKPMEISKKQHLAEARILYAFEVNDSCSCDTTICRIST